MVVFFLMPEANTTMEIELHIASGLQRPPLKHR
jgi:hypothetical protein